MKTYKQIGIFLLLGVMLVGLLICGCGRQIDNYKEEAIAKIDDRLAEIKTTEPEYGLTVIEYETEKAKEQIRNAKQVDRVQALTDSALETIDSLVLSEEEAITIKEACSLYQNGDRVSDDIVAKRQILYYLGKVGGYSAAIVKGDTPALLLPADKYYLAAGYAFEYLPEKVSLYKDGNYYSLQDVYLEEGLTESEFALIYERYSAICE